VGVIKVYCDTGGYVKKLKELEEQGVIEVYTFPYENQNRRIESTALPSEALFRDLGNIDKWDDMPGTFGDYVVSDKHASGFAPKLQATTRGGGLFKTKLPLIVPDPDFWCKAHASIEKIVGVGGQHRRDVLHLDSAYKSGCSCFLTGDKTDILANREALSELLGLRFFHPNDDWADFVAFVDERREVRYCQMLWIGLRSRGFLLLASYDQLPVHEPGPGPD